MESNKKCCVKKTVGKNSYSLAVVGGNVPADCLNSCVYTRDNDPDKMFCFGRGTETVTCQGEYLEGFTIIIFHYRDCSYQIITGCDNT